MKQSYILMLAVLISFSSNGQTLLAKWSFPTGTATDSLADGGVAANLNKAIRAVGTSAIDFTKNGFTTKSAQVTGWDNGSGSKCWQVSFSTTGYSGIKLSSRQQSGGNSPGPRDFKLQYKIGNAGNWNDVSGGTITTANDWTTSWINNLSLPSDCDGQALVYVRWLMNSNLPSSGSGNVLASGISKIDDIVINADIITGLTDPERETELSVFPNPVINGVINIQLAGAGNTIELLSMNGKVMNRLVSGTGPLQVETRSWPAGTYILRLISPERVIAKKLVIR